MTAIEMAFRRLEALDLAAIESTGDWGLGQMFNHLAQGVEFSMDGYPIEKPKLFQATVGTLEGGYIRNVPLPGVEQANVGQNVTPITYLYFFVR